MEKAPNGKFYLNVDLPGSTQFNGLSESCRDGIQRRLREAAAAEDANKQGANEAGVANPAGLLRILHNHRNVAAAVAALAILAGCAGEPTRPGTSREGIAAVGSVNTAAVPAELTEAQRARVDALVISCTGVATAARELAVKATQLEAFQRRIDEEPDTDAKAALEAAKTRKEEELGRLRTAVTTAVAAAPEGDRVFAETLAAAATAEGETFDAEAFTIAQATTYAATETPPAPDSETSGEREREATAEQERERAAALQAEAARQAAEARRTRAIEIGNRLKELDAILADLDNKFTNGTDGVTSTQVDEAASAVTNYEETGCNAYLHSLSYLYACDTEQYEAIRALIDETRKSRR